MNRAKKKKKQRANELALKQKLKKVDNYDFIGKLNPEQKNEEGRYVLHIDDRDIQIETDTFSFHLQATSEETAIKTGLKRLKPEQLKEYKAHKVQMK